jgi:hypothetical protein
MCRRYAPNMSSGMLTFWVWYSRRAAMVACSRQILHRGNSATGQGRQGRRAEASGTLDRRGSPVFEPGCRAYGLHQ